MPGATGTTLRARHATSLDRLLLVVAIAAGGLAFALIRSRDVHAAPDAGDQAVQASSGLQANVAG